MNPSPNSSSKPDLVTRSFFTAVLALFFFSGFSAVLYQIIWQRILGFFLGVDIQSATITVTAYMLGLGLGSLLGGWLSERMTHKKLLLLFVVSELAIGLFALASRYLYYDFMYLQMASVFSGYAAISMVAFILLLFPTFFMGLTLPLLSKAFVPDAASASRRIGYLYGMNTAGSALGALLGVMLVLPVFGLGKALYVGVLINLLVAAASLWIYGRGYQGCSEGAQAEPSGSYKMACQHLELFGSGNRKILLLFFVSGFFAISIELAWLRIFGALFQSAYYTFGLLLFVYLAGLGSGSIVSSQAMEKFVPGPDLLLQRFYCWQGTLIAVAVGSIFLFWIVLGLAPPIDISNSPRLLLMIGFFLLLLLVFPASFLMGYTFPLAQAILHTDAGRVGWRTGLLQAFNIGGCVLAGILTCHWLLHQWGMSITLRFLLAVGLAYWITAALAAREKSRQIFIGVAVGLGVGILYAFPTNHQFWSRLHGYHEDATVLKEDASGLSLIGVQGKSFGENDYFENSVYYVYMNGFSQSTLPFGSFHSVLGMVPVMLHPLPRDIAVIGLGSGDTLYSVGGRPETENIVVIEILSSQWPSLLALDNKRNYVGIDSLASDQRIDWFYTDARSWLMRSNRLFDVIEADALHPDKSYAGNLYSREYFQLLLDHLKPGGYALSWIPTSRTRNTFLSVFPYVLDFGNYMIGSNRPLQPDFDRAYQNADSPFARNYYGQIAMDPGQVLRRGFSRFYGVIESSTSGASADINTDLFPKDEFSYYAHWNQ